MLRQQKRIIAFFTQRFYIQILYTDRQTMVLNPELSPTEEAIDKADC